MNTLATLNNNFPAPDYEALLEQLPAVVVVLASNGRVCLHNQAASELFGTRLMGQSWRELVQLHFLPSLDQGELQTADHRQFSLSTAPRPDQPGQLLILTEVTSTRQLQQVLLRNRHLLGMGRMMASLAHQIRTPLSSAMLYLSQMTQATLKPEQWQRFSQQTLERVRQIEQTINDMLAFAHGGQFQMQDFDLQDLLRDLQQQLQPRFQQSFARLQLQTPSQPIYLHGNAVALSGALANLAINALQACEQGLLLKIEASWQSDGQLLLSLSDNGPGIDVGTAKHLFEPFYTTKTDGTGLGLAVVRSVIESHQGQIELDSAFQGGARFLIRLPCLKAHQVQSSHSHSRNTGSSHE